MKQIQKVITQTYSLALRYKVLAGFIAVVLIVLLGNSIYIFATNNNPLLKRSELSLSSSQIMSGSQNTIDPNDGYTTQALGTAAADQVLSGKLPLWNYYEGVGVSLLAETQSAALFLPFILLFKLPAGFLLFHMALEVIAGFGMFLLLRRLKLSWKVAILGAAAYALNGTFAWLTNAIFNPIAFMPWIILGVELVYSANRKRSILGIITITIALAYSLYSGFPEIAYINGLLVAIWATVRLITIVPRGNRLKSLIKIAVGVVGALLLAAPALIAFAAYLPSAYTGGHSGGFSNAAIPIEALPQLITPYVYGTIDRYISYDPGRSMEVIWGNIGGYIGTALVCLAIFGTFSKKLPKGLKIALIVWCIFALGRIFGAPVLMQVVNHIPALSLAAVYRYINASIVFSMIILACYGLQMMRDRQVLKRKTVLIMACILMILFVSIYVLAYFETAKLVGAPRHMIWFALSVGASFVALLIIIAVNILRWRWSFAVVGTILFIETLVAFSIPQLASPSRPSNVDTAPVVYLKSHIGAARFYTLGPIAPNYGSYFQVASINMNDLPIPSTWSDYVKKNLNTNVDPLILTGTVSVNPNGPTPKEELFNHLDNYKAVGVKYIVAYVGTVTNDETVKYGLQNVYQDSRIAIYELQGFKPYMSASNNCTIVDSNRELADVRCQGGGVLTRSELYMNGWQATVDGVSVPVQKNSIFQSVRLSSGEHVVKFTYWPWWVNPSIIFFVIGVLVVLSEIYLLNRLKRTIS